MKPDSLGLSPKATLTRFFKKDIIKPLERKTLYNKIKRPKRTNWSLNTTKKCSIKKNLPKYQQFKD